MWGGGGSCSDHVVSVIVIAVVGGGDWAGDVGGPDIWVQDSEGVAAGWIVWCGWGVGCRLGPCGTNELAGGGGTGAGEAHALAEATFESKIEAGFNCGYCDRVGGKVFHGPLNISLLRAACVVEAVALEFGCDLFVEFLEVIVEVGEHHPAVGWQIGWSL